MTEIIPAAIPHDHAELEKYANTIRGFADRFHLDVNDGVFDPAVSWPCGEGQFAELEQAAGDHRLPFSDVLRYEVHLMVSDPQRLGEFFARAGAVCVIAHVEAFPDENEARRTFQAWRASGAHEIGIALLLDTPLSKIDALASDVDIVHTMSIARVGFQKQAFEEKVIERIRRIHAQYSKLIIADDGGVSEGNVTALVEAGVTRLVVGSAIIEAPDPEAAYRGLLSRANAI